MCQKSFALSWDKLGWKESKITFRSASQCWHKETNDLLSTTTNMWFFFLFFCFFVFDARFDTFGLDKRCNIFEFFYISPIQLSNKFGHALVQVHINTLRIECLVHWSINWVSFIGKEQNFNLDYNN